MKKRPMKITRVQTINPPCGVRRSTLELSSAANAGDAEPRSRTSEKSEARMRRKSWRDQHHGASRTRRGDSGLELRNLALELERDDDAEERDALDERGENQRRGLDT